MLVISSIFSVSIIVSSPPQLPLLIQARWLLFFGHVAVINNSLNMIRALKVSTSRLPTEWRCSTAAADVCINGFEHWMQT